MLRSDIWAFVVGLARKSLFLVVLACGGVAPALGADKQGAADAGPSGPLLVCKEYGTVLGTFLTDLGGKDVKRLNFQFGEDVSPRFSPVDDRVLFASTRGGTAGLWMTNRQGEDPKRICDGDQGDWLPDGERIAFRRQGRIVVRSLGTGEESVITPAGWTSCSWPSSGPDGREVVFVATRDKADGLYLARQGEGEPKRLAAGETLGAPRWSPTGRRIAYQSGPHIWLMDANGGEPPVQLTTWGGVQRRPAWSPDGASVAFSLGPGPKGPWALAVIRADGSKCAAIPPGATRSALCSDWGVQKPGQKAGRQAAPARPPPRIRLWEIDQAAAPEGNWAVFCGDRKGWAAVAADKPATLKPSSGCGVENDQIVFLLFPGSARAVLVPKAAANSAVSFALLDPQGQEAGPVGSIHVQKWGSGADAVELESLSRSNGTAVKAAWAIGGSRALVQVTPIENADKLRIEAAMQCVVASDRFGNDLIADPETLDTRPAVFPWAPLVAGLFGNGSGMLMLVCPEPGQRVELRGVKGPSFAGADVALGKAGVAAGLVTGGNVWHLERFAAEGQADPLRFKWRPPMPAAWRLAVQGGGRRDSAFFSDKESAFFDGKDVLFPKGKDSPAAGRLGVIYLYGRTAKTPPEALAPMDLVRDALGLAAAQRVMDEDGLTGYRRAARATTWAELSVTLDALRYLFERQLEVQDSAYAGHLCDDLPPFLQGLDQRLKEYADFASELQPLCKPSEDAGLAAAAAKFAELDAKRRGLKGSEGILPLCTKIRQLTAKQSGENRKQSEECAKAILAAGRPREEMLRSYRKLTVSLRDAAGCAALTRPELIGLAEKVRALCQNVLRNRFYVEGDWRGEDYEVPAWWLGPRPYE
jgi:hypothetical protein